jgi:replicative DNA helicase
MTYPVAGRTGSAKSTLVLNMARGAAIAGHSVLIFKLEEPLKEALWRMHAATSQVDLRVFLRGQQHTLPADIADGWGLLRDLDIRFSDERRIERIERIARQHADAGGKLIIVDQLGMVQVADAKSIYEQVTSASNRLRELAKTTGCAIVIVTQVNRPAAKDKADLTIHDLRDSGAIENDAAAVVLVNRVVKPDAPRWQTDPMSLEILIGKNRYGRTTDPNNPIILNWWPRLCRIEDARRVPQEDIV